MILIISGPSGAGKNAVTAPLRDQPEDFVFSVSYTTRKMRPVETDGVEYRFISDEKFSADVADGQFLEWEPVFENKYGTKKTDFDSLVGSGKVVVAELDVKGMMNVKQRYDHIASVFILPPHRKVLEERLSQRGTESLESQEIRKARVEMELKYKDHYDYVIENDDLERARAELLRIIEAERARK